MPQSGELKKKNDVLEEYKEEYNKKFEMPRNFFDQDKINREQWDNIRKIKMFSVRKLCESINTVETKRKRKKD